MRRLLELDPSLSPTPKQDIAHTYTSQLSHILNELGKFSPLSLSSVKFPREQLFSLFREASAYFKNNYRDIEPQEAFFLGFYHLVPLYKFNLNFQDKITLLKKSAKTLEIARAHGDKMARATLIYNYLMLELLNQGNKKGANKKGAMYQKVVTLFKELGVENVSQDFESFLENIRFHCTWMSNEEDCIKSFFDLLCFDLAEKIEDFNTFSGIRSINKGG